MQLRNAPPDEAPGDSAVSIATGPPPVAEAGALHVRVKIFIGLLALLAALFSLPLASLFRYALHSELNSHALLVPFVTIYLVSIRWKQLPGAYDSAPSWAFLAAAAGLTAMAAAWFAAASRSINQNDYLTLTTLAFVCGVVAAGFAVFGSRWMRAAAFPFAFLLFMVPLPHHVVEALETASKLASAEAASLFFTITGTSFLRTGTVFQLPGITIQVAQECSGIRSSWVLIMTSLLAANLFLQNSWRRALLVAFVIPLGILRNGFRILVIGLLCVNFGPQMINSAIHRHGGPLFFGLSLLPLFGLLWLLRKGEGKRASVIQRSSQNEPDKAATD